MKDQSGFETEVDVFAVESAEPGSANALAEPSSPGLRIAALPRTSLLLLSGIVGLGSGLAGCAGMPLNLETRLGGDSDDVPSWSQIVAAEREAEALSPDEESWATTEDELPRRETSFQLPRARWNEPEPEVLPDEVRLGMSEAEVLDAWGEPREIEMAGSIALGAHRFIYPTSVLEGMGEERIVYFEDGRVAGWETVRR